MTKQVIHNARVVTADGVIDRGWLAVEDDTITGVGPGSPALTAGTEALDVGGDFVLPGYIDVHVHGGDGVRFDGGREAVVRAAAFHAQHGTTTLLAGIPTAPFDEMIDTVRGLAVGAASDRAPGSVPTVLGTYLEGPFLSETRRGAHDPALLRVPVADDVASLIDAGRGSVRVITIAPELPGAPEAIRALTAGGTRVSAGHSDADAAQFLAAFDAGADCLTHTFNGMRPPTHRDPAVFAAVTAKRAWCELICDGIHVDPVYVRMLRELAGTHRLVLITDAGQFAGEHADGTYTDSHRTVDVRGGHVYLTGTTTLAGSCLTMEAAAQNYAAFTGAGPVEIARATSGNAAARLGIDDHVGRLATGFAADLVVTDDTYAVTGVVKGGRWLRGHRQ